MPVNKYCVGNANEDKLIDVLAEKFGTAESSEWFRQMFTTLAKISSDRTPIVDIKLINNVLKELRYAFKVLARYRDIRKVVIFGSHRTPSKFAEYKLAEEFAKEIVEKDFMVITGGGEGIMEAGNKGAGAGNSFAVNIKLPTEQLPNPYVRGEKLITLRYFFTRKLIFIKESDATALFPGGFGTHDEAFEVLTLLQTGKTPPRPVVLVDKPFGWYWKNWLKFVKNDLMKNNLIHESDMNLFKVTNDVDEAVDYVANFYKNYHSLRYVGSRTIIRLNSGLTEHQIVKLNKNYKDIIKSGCIESCEPTKEEVRDKDHTDKFRLGLNFDRSNYGRLHELIHDINRL
jgi:uncharacterized protein (TIGR00730 family)